MTEKDYMCLPKKRLAELLVEKDNILSFIPYQVSYRPACWEPDGICTNPHMDCINCPKKITGGMFKTNYDTSIQIKEDEK